MDNQEPSSAQTPPALVSSKTVDVKKQNEPYIKEVVDASRSILDLALKGLRSDGGLRHAPVRTHFRILSGAMFLLKVGFVVMTWTLMFSNNSNRRLLLVERRMRSLNRSSYLRTSPKRLRIQFLTIVTYPYGLRNSFSA